MCQPLCFTLEEARAAKFECIGQSYTVLAKVALCGPRLCTVGQGHSVGRGCAVLTKVALLPGELRSCEA